MNTCDVEDGLDCDNGARVDNIFDRSDLESARSLSALKSSDHPDVFPLVVDAVEYEENVRKLNETISAVMQVETTFVAAWTRRCDATEEEDPPTITIEQGFQGLLSVAEATHTRFVITKRDMDAAFVRLSEFTEKRGNRGIARADLIGRIDEAAARADADVRARMETVEELMKTARKAITDFRQGSWDRLKNAGI